MKETPVTRKCATLSMDMVPQIKPHVADFGRGARHVSAGGNLMAATILLNSGAETPAIVIEHAVMPVALMVPVDVEHLRIFADQLLAIATMFEREAAKTADAAIRKAAGR
ncbi:hypothetical protein [Sphingomonas sp. GV3]|jgi:hypothetical protein|uniref:hypothetical protein n=1 Tax=Sphingomonas sp. GV3 TaxID=3040671 RepID=UPI00280C24CB|nr:hypothetical protein [Sphingomonas sp. GV3]